MVLPGDKLESKLTHVGMADGKMIVNVDTFNQEGVKVLHGVAHVKQPSSAYVFTGQGSQEKGMGMDLYETSPVAKEIWDRADLHFKYVQQNMRRGGGGGGCFGTSAFVVKGMVVVQKV